MNPWQKIVGGEEVQWEERGLCELTGWSSLCVGFGDVIWRAQEEHCPRAWEMSIQVTGVTWANI